MDDMTDKGLARRVNGPAARAIRLDRGLGLRFVADKAGISAPYLSRIERGIKGNRGVDPLTVERLAAVLSVSADALISANDSVTHTAVPA